MKWNEGAWLNPPARVVPDGDDLLVTAARGSDFWRTTSYGFVHDTGHALLVGFPDGCAAEVTFVLDFDGPFDQAGLLVWAGAAQWTKAVAEISDGLAQIGAVVTDEVSDWSTAPVPEWDGREVTVRASRSGDALTVRARVDAEPWRLVRLAPLPAGDLRVGPLVSAPERDDLTVRFTRFELGPADASVH
ncbi:DUF1349 domain-containing protein [Pseudonocardia sp. TRM90224]|uniref:DUF1349 domain-containing protein n=1 Tax=Pseudonocardia sp. TRM90224 TaxID=2812678 RepID=UPI001E4B6226|nr:DUF1349 domain-containing protein [Pseudonocardia sp. TRM90224]